MTTLLWLRRDLRWHDHAPLSRALARSGSVQPVFVFDRDILSRFQQADDRRLSFIAATLAQMHQAAGRQGGGVLTAFGRACEVIPALARALGATGVVAGEDYEPSSLARDRAVERALPGLEIAWVKDHVMFSPREILRGDLPYKVYTPYARAWRAAFTPGMAAPYDDSPTGRLADPSAGLKLAQAAGIDAHLAESPARMLDRAGYTYRDDPLWSVHDAERRLQEFIRASMAGYAVGRDFPARMQTSRLSPYLRFGLISVRECVRAAWEKPGAEAWIGELIWREFYAAILYHFPDSVHQEWNPAYRDVIPWRRDDAAFDAWREGRTGFPLVDAAMRELLITGWMHNRARMVVASFLTKHLLMDWRLGEAHFAQYLMDYEQASNVGGWQWAASTGTDAQPYFRVFNPYLQSRKFDPRGEYIRRYVPELASLGDEAIHDPPPLLRPTGYPPPLVDHDAARKRAILAFKKDG